MRDVSMQIQSVEAPDPNLGLAYPGQRGLEPCFASR